MTVFVDTNVLIAAFLTRGTCHDLVEHLVRNHQPAVSDGVLDEFSRVLRERFDVPPELAREAADVLTSRFAVVTGVDPIAPICRDPDDDHVLAAATVAEAHVLVSGDNDLLVLKSFEGIPILRPADFWAFELGGGG